MAKGKGGTSSGNASAAANSQFLKAAKTAAGVIDGHKDAGAVDSFLNVERMVASELQLNGYSAAAARFGADRAKSALAAVQGTNRALKAAAATLKPSVVYRGQTKGQASTGDRLVNRNIWSSTPDKGNALRFAAKGGPDSVVYKITTRSAVPTDGLKSSNTYREALIPSGTKFRKVGERMVSVGGKQVRMIELHED